MDLPTEDRYINMPAILEHFPEIKDEPITISMLYRLHCEAELLSDGEMFMLTLPVVVLETRENIMDHFFKNGGNN